jgi:hypothetical protein
MQLAPAALVQPLEGWGADGRFLPSRRAVRTVETRDLQVAMPADGISCCYPWVWEACGASPTLTPRGAHRPPPTSAP